MAKLYDETLLFLCLSFPLLWEKMYHHFKVMLKKTLSINVGEQFLQNLITEEKRKRELTILCSELVA